MTLRLLNMAVVSTHPSRISIAYSDTKSLPARGAARAFCRTDFMTSAIEQMSTTLCAG